MTPARRIARRLRHDESGLSMAELLVYVMLLAGVMFLVGNLLINSLRTQSTVSNITEATTAAQLVTRSLESGIRNSSGFTVTTVNVSDQLVLAQVRSGETTWRCEAWYFSPTEKTVRHFASNAKITAASYAPAAVKDWTVLASNVVPAEGLADTAGIFTPLSAKLTIEFRVLAGDNGPAVIHTSVSRRLTQGSTQCL